VGAAEYLRQYLQQQLEEGRPNFSNARLVRNLIERAIRRQALRLVDRRIYTRDDLIMLLREDFVLPEEEEAGIHLWLT
jgi:stage V sporulation protein K